LGRSSYYFAILIRGKVYFVVRLGNYLIIFGGIINSTQMLLRFIRWSINSCRHLAIKYAWSCLCLLSSIFLLFFLQGRTLFSDILLALFSMIWNTLTWVSSIIIKLSICKWKLLLYDWINSRLTLFVIHWKPTPMILHRMIICIDKMDCALWMLNSIDVRLDWYVRLL